MGVLRIKNSKISENIFAKKLVRFIFGTLRCERILNNLKEYIISLRLENSKLEYVQSGVVRKTRWSFIIAHYNAPEFLEICVDAIKKKTSGLDYQIIVADDVSNIEIREKVRNILPDDVVLLNLTYHTGHRFCLELMLSSVESEYVVVLDQDAIVFSSCWNKIEEIFINNKDLVVAGAKSECGLHPSFLVINKNRLKTKKYLPFFYNKQNIFAWMNQYKKSDWYVCLTDKIKLNEYHVFTSKASKYCGNLYCLNDGTSMVYHNWNSGRHMHLSDNQITDSGVRLKKLKQEASRFIHDYKTGVSLE